MASSSSASEPERLHDLGVDGEQTLAVIQAWNNHNFVLSVEDSDNLIYLGGMVLGIESSVVNYTKNGLPTSFTKYTMKLRIPDFVAQKLNRNLYWQPTDKSGHVGKPQMKIDLTLDTFFNDEDVPCKMLNHKSQFASMFPAYNPDSKERQKCAWVRLLAELVPWTSKDGQKSGYNVRALVVSRPYDFESYKAATLEEALCPVPGPHPPEDENEEEEVYADSSFDEDSFDTVDFSYHCDKVMSKEAKTAQVLRNTGHCTCSSFVRDFRCDYCIDSSIPQVCQWCTPLYWNVRGRECDCGKTYKQWVEEQKV